MSQKEVDIEYLTSDGKYTLKFYKSGEFEALRYNQHWRDLTGDGLVLSLLHDLVPPNILEKWKMSVINFPNNKEKLLTAKDVLENALNDIDNIEEVIIITFLKDDSMETRTSQVELKDILWAIKRLEHKIMSIDEYDSGE